MKRRQTALFNRSSRGSLIKRKTMMFNSLSSQNLDNNLENFYFLPTIKFNKKNKYRRRFFFRKRFLKKIGCTSLNLGTEIINQDCYICPICNPTKDHYICKFCYKKCHENCRKIDNVYK